jgi:hypothetical protein
LIPLLALPLRESIGEGDTKFHVVPHFSGISWKFPILTVAGLNLPLRGQSPLSNEPFVLIPDYRNKGQIS